MEGSTPSARGRGGWGPRGSGESARGKDRPGCLRLGDVQAKRAPLRLGRKDVERVVVGVGRIRLTGRMRTNRQGEG